MSLRSELGILIRRHVRLQSRDMRLGRAANPFANEPPVFDAPDSPRRLGILAEPFHHHWPYIAGCRELSVSYRLLDITGDDWREQITDSECDAFLTWPCMGWKPYRELFDERLRIIEEDLGRIVYPCYAESRLYENKLRLAEWLQESGLPHAESWVFRNQAEALAFAEKTELPVVIKTSLGAMSSGVWIVRLRPQLQRIIRKAFCPGLLADYRHKSERERGVILIQRFLPEVREWRMVRVGGSYFGHQKGKFGEFHSGSGLVDWAPPDKRHLDFLHEVTEIGGFRSMAVDMFETPEGDLLVNELQTVFSARTSVDQMKKNGVAGRMIRREQGAGGRGQGEEEENIELRTLNVERRSEEQPTTHNPQPTTRWIFEPGDFARNACCNLRVEDLLKLLS